MAPSIVTGHTTFTSTSGTAKAITAPTTAEGDLVLVFFVYDSGGLSSSSSDLTILYDDTDLTGEPVFLYGEELIELTKGKHA